MMAEENQSGERKRHRTWVRALQWAAFCVGALILIVVVIAVEAVHSPRLHKYLVALAERKASQSLGVPVSIEDYALHFPNAPSLSKIDLDVDGLVVSGAEPHPNPPLVQIQHVKAEVGLSVLAGKWSLENLRVDAPIVHIFTDRNGESNLPKSKGGGGGNFNLFSLGIRHLVLDRGEVYYQDEKIPIEADLRNLELRAHSNSGSSGYSGTLSYRDGHLRAGSLNTIPHNLDARFDATPTSFELSEATLTSGPSRFKLTATMNGYAHPVVNGHYEALLDGSQLQAILKNTSIPAGLIDASGSFGYRSLPGRPFLRQLSVNGGLHSGSLNLNAANMLVQLRSVAAQYLLANGELSVKNLRAQLLGGAVQAGFEMSDLGGNSHAELKADARRLSLSGIKQTAVSNSTARNLALSGIVDASVTASWGKDLQRSLVAQILANIHGGLSARHHVSAASQTLPINGVLRGKYIARDKRLELAHSYLHMPQTSLTMDGAIGRQSSLTIDFVSKDLHELETVSRAIRSPNASSTPAPLGLGGTASFQGRVTGTTASPRLTGHLSAANLKVKGTSWRSLQTTITADPSTVRLENTELKPAQGQIHLNATVGLTKWKLEKSSHLQVDLRASRISMADVSKLVSLPADLTGTLAANIHFDGSQANPAGHGTVSLSDAQIYNEPVRSVEASFTAEQGAVNTRAAIQMNAGTIESTATIRPQEKSYTAQIESNGLDLSKLQLLRQHDVNVTGKLLLSGSGNGTFQNPRFTASAKAPSLTISGHAMTDFSLQMNLANHLANAVFSAREENAPIQAKATLQMVGDYPIHASLDTQPIQLAPFFAIYAPGEADQLNGEAEVHATVDGPLKKKDLLNAQITVPLLKVGYGSAVNIAAQSPIHIGYKDQVLTIDRTSLHGTDIDLTLQGSIPMHGHGTPSLLVNGAVNLQIAHLLDSDINSSGELRLNINGAGAGGPQGKIELVNANLVNGNWPVGLEHGNAQLTLTNDHLKIDSLSASVGGGQLTASGGLAYRPQLAFDLGLAAKGVRMLYPQGVREQVDADIRLTGGTGNAELGGRVNIVDIAFTPDFDFTNLISQFGGVSTPPSQGFAQNLNLNLAVHSTNNIDLVSRTMSIGGTANLMIRGTAAQPVILGRIDLTDGDVIFNGNRFVISGGTVEFANPSETQPVLNLGLSTTIQQYNINMRFRGPVDHMRTNFSSDPALPEADIISLLAFGNTTEANSANPATPGSQAAMSAVASQVSSQITSRVSRIAGISHLSINPVLSGGSNQGPAGAVITIQQRVTGNLFVTFSTNVTSTQYQTIMGQYRITPRTAVSATRDQNGGFGFDVTLKKTW